MNLDNPKTTPSLQRFILNPRHPSQSPIPKNKAEVHQQKKATPIAKCCLVLFQ